MKSSGITVKTKDGIEVEITHCDSGYAPDSKPINIKEETSVWFKPNGGNWMRSKDASAIKTAYGIKTTAANDLNHLAHPEQMNTHVSEQEEANRKATS